jgi:hypothetical protein
VLPAVETSTQQRPPIVDRASRGTKIDAVAIRFSGKQKNRISRHRIDNNAVTVRLDLISLFRVENKTLITSAALCTSVARHAALFVYDQTPV